jgi:hypothetical protein
MLQQLEGFRKTQATLLSCGDAKEAATPARSRTNLPKLAERSLELTDFQQLSKPQKTGTT